MEAKLMNENSLPEVPKNLGKYKITYMQPRNVNFFDGTPTSSSIILHNMRVTKLSFWYKEPIY